MLKIRLSRIGKSSQPAFRIVVQQHTASAKGKFIEALGFYRPVTATKEITVNADRIKHWLSVGAQPSDAVAVLLKKEGFDGMEKYIEPRDKKKKKKGEEEPAKPVAAPVAAKEEPKVEEPKVEEAAPAEAPKEESKE